VTLPTAEILHEGARYGLFRTNVLEGAWSVDRRAGLDDLLTETPGPWDRIYFEKGDFGFIRLGGKRIRFDAQVDPAGGMLTLSGLDAREALPLKGRFELHGRQLHIMGERNGRPFLLELARELPQ
jgi:hypothetical protein